MAKPIKTGLFDIHLETYKSIPSYSKGVYMFCAEDGHPLYIGSSHNLRDRIRVHHREGL